MRYTKRILTLCFLLFSVTAIAQSQAKKIVADKIAAIVGDRIILQSDIKNSIADIARQGGTVPEDAQCLLMEQAVISKVLMLQAEKADDFVLATGETHTVREFVELAFAHAGITIKWVGEMGTVNEMAVDVSDEERVVVRIDPEYFRPTEVDLLLGDPTKAKTTLGWTSQTSFKKLVEEMVDADLAMVRGQKVDEERLLD